MSRLNPVDWWGWWDQINDKNNPHCYYHYLERMKNNPPGMMPNLNGDVPF